MKIEQPEHLRPLYAESFRQGARLGIWDFVGGLIFSAIMLGLVALNTLVGRQVAPWQWLGGAMAGPCFIAMVRVWLRIYAESNRFAEIRGNRVRLGPGGSTFRLADLALCKIVPDDHFPEINHLCVVFRPSQFARPKFWSMMVEDLDEAEKFRRTLAERVAEPSTPADPTRRDDHAI